MACAGAPTKHADLCTNSTACARAFTKEVSDIDDMNVRCKDNVESDYSTRPAPVGSGLNGTSLVTLVAVEPDDWPIYTAFYLVADFSEGGSCLVDVVHGWEIRASDSETTFDTQWKPAPGGFRLQVASRRIVYQVLDAEEREAGESDVSTDYCERITYDVVEGRFTRVAQTSTKGSCGE
jgi:hypothetical protein